MATIAKPGLLRARALLVEHLDIHKGQTVDADLDPAEVGIVGDTAHRGGYHCGRDRILANDYSVVESPRDRAGLSDFASGLDVGAFAVKGRGRTWTLRDFSTWLVALCVAGDPDAADIREVIYSADGRTVRRWDRLGRRTSGDSSHLFHTHISEFRDASGDRMVALARRWIVHIGLLPGGDQPTSLAGGEDNDMFTNGDRAKLEQVHSLLTTGARGAGLADTAGGGVPIASIQKQFWEVDGAVAAVGKAVEDIRTRLEALAVKDTAAPAGQVTAGQLQQVFETALRAALSSVARGEPTG